MESVPPESLLDSVSQRLYAIAFVAVAFFAIGRIRQYLRLRHFAGPRTTGFSWLWHSRAVIGGQSPRYYGEVCEKYGTCQEGKSATRSGGLILILLIRADCQDRTEPPHNIRPRILGTDQCRALTV